MGDLDQEKREEVDGILRAPTRFTVRWGRRLTSTRDAELAEFMSSTAGL